VVEERITIEEAQELLRMADPGTLIAKVLGIVAEDNVVYQEALDLLEEWCGHMEPQDEEVLLRKTMLFLDEVRPSG
jgi:hypothetical protein